MRNRASAVGFSGWEEFSFAGNEQLVLVLLFLDSLSSVLVSQWSRTCLIKLLTRVSAGGQPSRLTRVSAGGQASRLTRVRLHHYADEKERFGKSYFLSLTSFISFSLLSHSFHRLKLKN